MNTSEADPHYPRTVADMAGASDWRRLECILGGETPPNLILAGQAGVGKSCALRLILRGHINMWLRCSQDPTLRDSRDRIKAAARRKAVAGEINWIVLEHADLLHSDAQAFLRRVIETSLGACRFVMEVRDLGALGEPLISRAILFNAPHLVTYEIRAEIMRRAPSISLENATRISKQSGGNVRWAVLQGLAGGDGYVDSEVFGNSPPTVSSWQELLSVMERISETGTSPRAVLDDTRPVWDRNGGACPWALTAYSLAQML